jgi:prophage regulatory protein
MGQKEPRDLPCFAQIMGSKGRLLHNHPIFVPTPATSLLTKSRTSVIQQQSLSIAVDSEIHGELEMASTTEKSIKRTVRRQQLREMVPLADSTIYEMEQRGEFPRRFALSPRCVVWDLSEVEAWLALRRSAPIARAQHPDVTQRRSRPVKAPGRAPRAASTME